MQSLEIFPAPVLKRRLSIDVDSIKKARHDSTIPLYSPMHVLDGKIQPVETKLIYHSFIPYPTPVDLAPAHPAVPVTIEKCRPKTIYQFSLDQETNLSSDNGKRSWNVIKPLGKGGCGEVYLAKEIQLEGSKRKIEPNEVALKIVKDKKQFASELRTLKKLNSHKFGRGQTPRFISSCRKQRLIIMEYLNETLASCFELHNFNFSLKTVLLLAMEMLTLSKEFYEKTGQVHIDLKPSNFCVGRTGRNLALIDFGYATHPESRLPGQTGTPIFMAVNIQLHGAICPSWEDDLESIGYIIMYFLAGGKKGLPWGALRSHKEIVASKSDEALIDFCVRLKDTKYAPVSTNLLTYLLITRDRTRQLDPNDDFSFLYGLFSSVMELEGYVNDGQYDFTAPHEK